MSSTVVVVVIIIIIIIIIRMTGTISKSLGQYTRKA